MLHAGWPAVVRAEKDPASYQPTDELFTPDAGRSTACCCTRGQALWRRGERLAPVGLGRRARAATSSRRRPSSRWPATKPLAEAIRWGIAQGHASSAIPAEVRAEQVAFWVRELIDITLLDYLFSQQDRIGNIDYLPHWVWVRRRPGAATARHRQQAAGRNRGPVAPQLHQAHRTGRQRCRRAPDLCQLHTAHRHARAHPPLPPAHLPAADAPGRRPRRWRAAACARALDLRAECRRVRAQSPPMSRVRRPSCVPAAAPDGCASTPTPRPTCATAASRRRPSIATIADPISRPPDAPCPNCRAAPPAPGALPAPVHRRARRRGRAAAAAGVQHLPDPHLVLPDEAGSRGTDPRPAARCRAEELRLRRAGGAAAGDRAAVRRAGGAPVAPAADQRASRCSSSPACRCSGGQWAARRRWASSSSCGPASSA